MHTVVLITGGFDPIHSGHIAYFEAARKLGDILVVGVNSDAWLTRKKGQPFMNHFERMSIVQSMKVVDVTLPFNDNDGTAKNAIEMCLNMYPQSKIIFANGGDRTNTNIPEMSIDISETDMNRLEFIFGVGGEHKMNSSSKILTEWKNPKTERTWGYYRVLHSDGPSLKVKELVVEPGKSLSMQKHNFRNEYWIVSEGIATVNLADEFHKNSYTEILETHDEVHIPVNTWHQLQNNTDEKLKIVEIQYGINCIEEDIIRI